MGADKLAANRRRALGRYGEELAARWYERHGYEVVARNWSCRVGELDIVARRGDEYVFCEVKTRSTATFGLPAESVSCAKRARLRRLAAIWLSKELTGPSPGQRRRARFDVACVLAGRLEVIEEAF